LLSPASARGRAAIFLFDFFHSAAFHFPGKLWQQDPRERNEIRVQTVTSVSSTHQVLTFRSLDELKRMLQTEALAGRKLTSIDMSLTRNGYRLFAFFQADPKASRYRVTCEYAPLPKEGEEIEPPVGGGMGRHKFCVMPEGDRLLWVMMTRFRSSRDEDWLD